MNHKKSIKIASFILVIIVILISIHFYKKGSILSPKYGEAIDSLNHIKVYYNGRISNVNGRNLSKDKYDIGLKYQCVEFVKRYYYEFYNHKMPNSYGHAFQFFDSNLVDNSYNSERDLFQYQNPSKHKPQVGDLVVYSGHSGKCFGHVSIVAMVEDNSIEIIQQNTGVFGRTRAEYKILNNNGLYYIDNPRILGFLRKEKR
ncbi:MAG: CHAP domain-containing protein [Bacteroidia bacterium]